MANKLITNIFDSALQTYVDDSKKYEAGNETCFTNNKIIAAVKSQVAAMVPEAELKTSATVSEWTNVFCFEMEYRLTYKNIYSHMRGFYIGLAYERTVNDCDKYTVSLSNFTENHGWERIAFPNKAEAFRIKAAPSRSYDKSLTFYDPSEELIKGFVNALVTPNRRRAFQQFINDDKKDAIVSSNTKNMLDIESIEIIPELERITKDACMGIPEVIDEPNCRKIMLLRGQYGCRIELAMFKDFMRFNITHGSDYNTDHFDTNFIRLLNGHFGQFNIDLGISVPYDKKEQVFDMLKRIGDCYKKTRFLIGYDAWYGLDDMWKMNPNKE